MTDIVKEILDNHGDTVLVHYGVLGMRWHHHKGTVSKTSSRGRSRFTSEQKRRAKKIAIGVGVTAAILGTAYVAYRLNQSGKIALPRQHRNAETIDRLLAKHGSVRLNRREYASTHFRRVNKDNQLSLIKTMRIREGYLADYHRRSAVDVIKTQIHGALRVKELLRSERGSIQISDMDPKVLSSGKTAVQTLYTKWVNIQTYPITDSILNGALDLVK